ADRRLRRRLRRAARQRLHLGPRRLRARLAAAAVAARGGHLPRHRVRDREPRARGRGAAVSARAAMFTLAAGTLFGAGLAWSTMLRPEVVLAFLHLQDLGLLLVLGGAVMVTLLGYRLAPRLLGRPLAGGAFGAH